MVTIHYYYYLFLIITIAKFSWLQIKIIMCLLMRYMILNKIFYLSFKMQPLKNKNHNSNNYNNNNKRLILKNLSLN